MRFLLTTILLISFIFSQAQITENFDDGNFTSNPQWTGDDSVFVVSPVLGNNQLQSNKTIANSTFYLSTPNTLFNDCQWEFFVNLQFNTSGANYVDVYLTSDNASLTAAGINGYYVRIGSTQDDICLYKKVSGTASKIIDGTDGITNFSNNSMKIKVVRTASNDWTLYRDMGGSGNNYFLEGTVNDASVLTSDYFGFSITQSTATFFQKHFFDDIVVGAIVADVIPPTIVSCTAISPSSVDVLFSEAVSLSTSENVGNYGINNGINISTAIRDAINPALVHLTFSNTLTANIPYVLTVNNVTDLANNIIASNSTINFSYIVASSAQYRDIVINELYPDQTPLVGLPNAEFVEIYNRSNSALNISGWKLCDPGTNGTIGNYTMLPGQYLILCPNADTALYSAFGAVVGVSSWPSLNNASDQIFLKTDNGVLIDSVSYSDTWYQDAVKAAGGWTLEMINPSIPSDCAGSANWLASNNPSGGTPGQVNSVYNAAPDITAPYITGIETPTTTSLNLCFNEPIHPQMLILSNFSINNGIGNPLSISINNSCVSLTLANPLQLNTNYTITCNNLSDCSGNNMTNNTYNFLYFMPSQFDVVINEIMADPSPQIGLPDAEYFELYNRTNYNISTNGWTFQYGNTMKNFPNAVIPADSFLVVTTSSALPDLSMYGNVVAMSGLSSTALTNSGTTLSIKDNNGQLIHSVTYSDQWYNDASKAGGGWSLEMIDPSNPCAGAANWSASNNPDGGTPGKRNSILGSNPDNIAPNIGSVRILNSNQIEVEFSEPVMNFSFVNASDYQVNNGIGNASSVNYNTNPATKATLYFMTPFQPNTIYTLALNAPLTDCSGNSSQVGMSAEFSSYIAKAFDIVINEIMADPDPVVGLPNYEYVELYNRTSYPINIAHWRFMYGSSYKSLPSATLNPNEYVILCASDAYQSLKNYGKTIVVPGLSTGALTNSGATLAITDTLGRIIHAINYSDAWYGSSDKANGGYSLEQIDYANVCEGKNNWTSSVSPLGGTPGAVNSVIANNPDNKAPLIKAVCVESPSTLRIKFNEPQDSSSIAAPSTFIIDNSIGTPSNVKIFAPFYNEVLLSFNSNFADDVIYKLSISGTIKDCIGNSMAANTTYNFSQYQPQPYEIVINEIMAHETPAVGLPPTEYVELFNKSAYPISLLNYNIKTGSSNTMFSCASIAAGDYLTVLQKSGNPDENIYGNNYVAESFSSLTNAGAEITLSSNTGKILSTVNYSEQWYNNTLKAAGGWSLEQKDPNNPCGGKDNWSASTDAKGGTPGKVNSVNSANPDTKAPEIIRIAFLSNTNIVVYFSEPLNMTSIVNVHSYDIDNGIGNPLAVVPYLPEVKKVGLIFSTPIQPNTIYTLSINGNITDCVGNLINTLISGKFSIPQAVAPGDIILNELLFNPNTGGYDFAEFYNKSNKVLSLNSIKIANVDTMVNQISNLKFIDSLGYLIFPSEYYVVSQNIDAVQMQYKTQNPNNFINVVSMPSMNVGNGSFGLILNNDTVIDALMYDENMHYPLIRNKKGVSLERISFNRSSSDLSNWHSASEQVGFATPGYQNSQFMDDTQATDVISFATEIFSPDNDGFNDVLIINYALSEPGFVASATVYDARGRYINKLIDNQLLGTSGSFSWDGITESREKGNIGIYTLFFEYFDTKGNSYKIRKSFVLGGKL
ncbi:MAG: lamin tail domain-containing protein [Bacteroidia bacterium]|nr:lamin tail domain-containing protein [Bacteroidia bacterium]MCZ2247641.1 lamin tail domain-containing protein [Bacteroidia bacterium]